ncbi:hypothetical protein B0H13DRAFT_2549477 [Mycena leptocephala]|nr:hypothetical protein B0H13DRAFT_2549477 [Mycena leptocephala]
MTVVGNQCDKVNDHEVTKGEGAAALGRQFSCEYLETSAKMSLNVERAFTSRIRILRETNHPEPGAAPIPSDEREGEKEMYHLVGISSGIACSVLTSETYDEGGTLADSIKSEQDLTKYIWRTRDGWWTSRYRRRVNPPPAIERGRRGQECAERTRYRRYGAWRTAHGNLQPPPRMSARGAGKRGRRKRRMTRNVLHEDMQASARSGDIGTMEPGIHTQWSRRVHPGCWRWETPRGGAAARRKGRCPRSVMASVHGARTMA